MPDARLEQLPKSHSLPYNFTIVHNGNNDVPAMIPPPCRQRKHGIDDAFTTMVTCALPETAFELDIRAMGFNDGFAGRGAYTTITCCSRSVAYSTCKAVFDAVRLEPQERSEPHWSHHGLSAVELLPQSKIRAFFSVTPLPALLSFHLRHFDLSSQMILRYPSASTMLVLFF